MDGQLHFGVDATSDHKVACLGQRQRAISTGLLVTPVESEPIRFNEGVVDGNIIFVDEGECIASMQEQVSWIVLTPLL
ncbi:hypothetical protein [Methylobacterium sp. WL116]|uniref:hypothetical protein n=1 Tax=Methylobacterium sp. WL116 TaxID=2603889 RepID=UPI001650B74E|nr:hypothetical protein [Methylobacterium sp. WL116]